MRLVSARAGMNWGSLGHTGVTVPLYAIGVQAHRFSGNLDNTLVCWYLRELITEGLVAKQEQTK